MLAASVCAAALAAVAVVEPSPWGDVSVSLPEIADRAFPIAACSNDVNAAMAACDIRGDSRRPIGRVALENVAVESVRGESVAKNVASLVVR